MEEKIKDFQQAIVRLEEALKLRKTKTTRDSALLRFQLCFDLAWKSIKLYAKNQGLECFSPKSCFQTAYQLKLIDYEEKWLEMIDDRNKIVHVYEEPIADKIYSKLKNYLQLFKDLNNKLQKG